FWGRIANARIATPAPRMNSGGKSAKRTPDSWNRRRWPTLLISARRQNNREFQMKGLSLAYFKRIRPYGILLLLLLPAIAAAQDAADFFRQNCVSCHTIGGGRLTG